MARLLQHDVITVASGVNTVFKDLKIFSLQMRGLAEKMRITALGHTG